MLTKMKKNKFYYIFIFFCLIVFPLSNLNSETIILSSCDNNKDGFLKNEYKIDLEKSIMTRNYVYNSKTFKKYKITDLSVKRKNTLTRFVYKEDNKILTEKIVYHQFYTQLIFKIDNPNIKIKTVINGEEGISQMSACKKIERFEKES
jgi:hypothetical protein